MLPDRALHCTMKGQQGLLRLSSLIAGKYIFSLESNRLVKIIGPEEHLACRLQWILHRNVFDWGSSHLLKRQLRKLQVLMGSPLLHQGADKVNGCAQSAPAHFFCHRLCRSSLAMLFCASKAARRFEISSGD